jgi:chromosome segregation ATPase
LSSSKNDSHDAIAQAMGAKQELEKSVAQLRKDHALATERANKADKAGATAEAKWQALAAQTDRLTREVTSLVAEKAALRTDNARLIELIGTARPPTAPRKRRA